MKEAGSKIAEKGRGKDFILHGLIYLLCFSKLILFFLKSISYSILEGKEAAKDYAAAAKHATKDTVAEKGSGKQLIASFLLASLIFFCMYRGGKIDYKHPRNQNHGNWR